MGKTRFDFDLITEVTAGRVESAAEFLKRGANPRARNGKDNPALVIAVQNQDVEMARLLLTAGADVWDPGLTGNAMEWAVSNDDPMITALLIEHGTPIIDDTPMVAFGHRMPRTSEEKRQWLIRTALDEGKVHQAGG